MKKHVRILFPVMFALLLAVSVISVLKVIDVRNYGKLINYVGIVRGASQRVVKLETNGRPADELIAYIDDILEELKTGRGAIGLVNAESVEYKQDLILLSEQWNEIKEEVAAVRAGNTKDKLLDSSEKLFEIANETVFSIEEFSNETAERVSKLIIVTALVCGVDCAFAIYFYVRRLFDLKNTNKRLEELANRDELTGAYNMEKFYAEADRVLKSGENKKVAILCVDFENFRYVNDVFGYNYGDELLKNYARVLMDGLGRDEVLGRMMADRFAVLRCYESKDELLCRQRDMDSDFLNSVAAASNPHLMTVSCGICCVEDLVEEANGVMMVNRAGFAQKAAKNQPGEKYAFYDEGIRSKLIAEMSIRDRMQKGLEDREFVVYLQPKVGVKDGSIKAAEALVRWEIPGYGLLSPGLFIPVLEKNHFIGKVDRYVFENVCQWLRGRLDSGLPVVPVSVNVSKIQFYNPDFIQVYAGIRERYKIPEGLLEIELTESAAFERQDYLSHIVTELHENGFLCSLDDFGSGFSSLGMLKDLAIDALKLDGTFFRVSVNINREHTIVKSIIHMVKELNISTIAEGVEHEEQVEFLKTTDCDLIQGFVYYKPMALSEFERLLDENGKAQPEKNS